MVVCDRVFLTLFSTVESVSLNCLEMADLTETDDVAIEKLTRGFAQTAHAPLLHTASKVGEAADALEAAAAALSAEQTRSAATEEQLAQLSASMTRMAAYIGKTQKLVRDMKAVHEKAAQLRLRVEKIEQKQHAADAQMAEFARADATREASLEAQPAATGMLPTR
jgi:chromosome segregation ATPase